MKTIGRLDLVPPARRVGGPAASYLLAPFTHASTDRPTRFSDGRFGVLYAGNRFEVALLETIYHHGRFLARTAQPPGWTSQFREIQLAVGAFLPDLRAGDGAYAVVRAPDYYHANTRHGPLPVGCGPAGASYLTCTCHRAISGWP